MIEPEDTLVNLPSTHNHIEQSNHIEQLVILYSELELRLGAWMEKHGLSLLRLGMGIVFFWFGALKPLGLSPATELVAKTTTWIPIEGFINLLGFWEMAIGLCFIYAPLVRVALILLFMHMPGTLLPLVMLPAESYIQFPFVLTMEGQYIIKNLVLVAAGIVIGGKVRHRMQGLFRLAPDEFTSLLHKGTWAVARPGDVLVQQGEEIDNLCFIHSGRFAVQIDGQEVVQRTGGHFVGEMSFLTKGTATATIEILETTRYIVWDKSQLEELMENDSNLYHSLLSSMSLNLVTKLLSPSQSLLPAS